jgi:DNA repair exonuclease SbcCD ATPase subunit
MVTLYNYIGIYNGMGIYILSIDFTKCKNDIIVIKGDNGSGKSTLSRAISPSNDSASDFIPGKEGGKDISYILNNGEILFISYRSLVNADGERKKSTCHVHRQLLDGQMIDLNPNGNVNEGKDIIFDILDLDAGFVTLSQLSSEDRGLADKKPADRKKFINSIMDSLEVYNNIYKMLTKRSTTLKAMLNSISAKIDSLGNIEQIQNSIKTLENTLGSMEDRKVLLISNMSTAKEKISNINKDGNVIDIYNSLNQELSNITTILSSSQNIIDSALTEKDQTNYEKELYINKAKKQAMEDKINDLNKQSATIANDIETKKIKLSSIGDIDLFNTIQGRITDLESSLNNAIRIFKSIGFENYDAVSEDEYKFSLNTIDKINMFMNKIRDSYSYDIIETACVNTFNYKRQYGEDILQSMVDHKQEIEKLLAGQSVLKQSCKDFNMIPKDCNHTSDCPFITSIVKAKSNLLPDDDYNNLVALNENLDKEIEQLKIDMSVEQDLIDCINLIKQIISTVGESYSILSKFPNMKNIKENDLKKLLLNGMSIDLDTRTYLEYSNLISMIKSNHTDIKVLKDQLSSISANKEMIEMLSSDINKLTISYSELTKEKDKYIGNMFVFSTKIIDLERDIEKIKYILEEKAKMKSRLDRKKELEIKLPKLNNEYIEAQRLNQSISSGMIELQTLNNSSIPEVSNEINKNKYKLVLHDDYVKEYKEYTKEYDMVETIKYYSSPTTGIQTIFMEIYMNDIIKVSNELLALFFNGEYVLHPFVINENEFRMPCLGKGIMNDDTSSMSTSQICMISMILSFALLRKASDRFDIIKIDEIDGGLDPQNRLQFIIVLRKLMKLLNYSQCVMISHNAELSMYNADIIVLRNSDANLKLDGNVIFQL